jgi:hypothetical protein
MSTTREAYLVVALSMNELIKYNEHLSPSIIESMVDDEYVQSFFDGSSYVYGFVVTNWETAAELNRQIANERLKFDNLFGVMPRIFTTINCV